MANQNLNARIKLRSDTAINWQSTNPILLLGEVGIETTTNKFKIGDGVKAWNGLAYCISNDSDKAGLRSNTIIIAPANANEQSKICADIILIGNATDVIVINAAITSLSASGGHIKFMEGEIYCSNSINLSSNVAVSGQGNSTVFKYYSGSYVFNLNNCNNNIVENLSVVSDNNSGTAFYLNNCENTTLTNIVISNLSSGLIGITCINSNFTNLTLKTFSYGLAISAAKYCKLLNIFSESINSGLLLDSNSTYCSITNSYFIGKDPYMIYLYGCHNSMFNSVYVKSTEGYYSMVLSNSNYNLFSNCILESTANRIVFIDSSNNTFVGNQLPGGAFADNGSGNKGNTFYGNKT